MEIIIDNIKSILENDCKVSDDSCKNYLLHDNSIVLKMDCSSKNITCKSHFCELVPQITGILVQNNIDYSTNDDNDIIIPLTTK